MAVAPHAVDSQPVAGGGFGVIEVAAVEDDRLSKFCLQSREVGRMKLLPFRGEDQAIGPFKRFVSVSAEDKVRSLAIQAAALVHRLGVVSADPRPGLPQPFHDGAGGRGAHVVGVRLEGQPPQREGAPGEVVAEMAEDLGKEEALLRFVALLDGVEHRGIEADLLCGADQRLQILGKAGASIADTGIDEVVADAGVRTDAAPDILDVGPQNVRKIGDLVHQTDLGRKHAVGRIFRQFGAAHVHDDDLFMITVEWRVEIAQCPLGRLIGDADDDAIRLEAIGDSGAFFQEFGVGDDVEFEPGGVARRQPFGNPPAHPVAGADGNGRLDHHRLRLRHMGGNVAGHREYVAEIGRPVLVGRRADCDEDYLAMTHALRGIRSETQPSGLQIVGDQAFEPRLKDRDFPAAQARHLLRVDVDAADVVSDLGKYRSLDQAHIAASKNSNTQDLLPFMSLWPAYRRIRSGSYTPGGGKLIRLMSGCGLRRSREPDRGPDNGREGIPFLTHGWHKQVNYAGRHLEAETSMITESVLITGGTGSFGQTMLQNLLDRGYQEIRVFSRDEEKQDALRNRLRSGNVRFYIGDVRDRESVDRAMGGVTRVFHAAALKQVPSCEFFPLEAVRTNILGSDNVIHSAVAAGVRSVVCLSTDKAVMPVNAMGMSKAMMEKTAVALARSIGPNAATTISLVRYGNVMYSRGSAIPLFIEQIKSGMPITVTEGSMTRFLMPLTDSVALVHHAFTHAQQGDLFIRKAPASTIADLARALAELFGVPDHPIEKIGWRHGEKLYETLATAQELSKSEDMGDYYRIRMDSRDLNYKAYFSEGDDETAHREDYHSHNTERLDVEGVKSLLLSLPQVREELELWRGAQT